MKKPHQSKAAKVQDALQKAERRNFQKGGTKKRAVFLPSNPANLTPAPKKKVKRKPYKLHDATINALINSIDNAADAPLECHIGAAGITRETFNQWRKIAEAEPGGEHAKQIAKVDLALFRAWRRLHQAAVRHKASEALFRRHGEHYPSERMRLDVTSGDLPIADQSFVVLLELHPPAGVTQQQSEKSFEVQEVTGERWKWTPQEDKRRRPGDNGKLP